MTEPIKHDAKWLHSNGLDSKDIGNVRGAKAYLEQHRPNPLTDRDANYLYGLVGKLAQILDEQEKVLKAARQAVYYCTMATGWGYWQELANAVFELEADDRGI